MSHFKHSIYKYIINICCQKKNKTKKERAFLLGCVTLRQHYSVCTLQTWNTSLLETNTWMHADQWWHTWIICHPLSGYADSIMPSWAQSCSHAHKHQQHVILHCWAGQTGDSLAKAHSYSSLEPGLDVTGQTVADTIRSSEQQSQDQKECDSITRLHWAMGCCTHSRPRNFCSLQFNQLKIYIFWKGKGKKYVLKADLFCFPYPGMSGKAGGKEKQGTEGIKQPYKLTWQKSSLKFSASAICTFPWRHHLKV